MEQEKTSIAETIAFIVVVPLILIFKLLVLAMVFLFLASPLILIGYWFAN